MDLRWSSSLTAMPGVKLELVESVILIRKTLTADPAESLLDRKSDTTVSFVLLRCLYVDRELTQNKTKHSKLTQQSVALGFEMLQVVCSFGKLKLKSLLGLQGPSVSCVWIV